jgi:hypothetical protein
MVIRTMRRQATKWNLVAATPASRLHRLAAVDADIVQHQVDHPRAGRGSFHRVVDRRDEQRARLRFPSTQARRPVRA